MVWTQSSRTLHGMGRQIRTTVPQSLKHLVPSGRIYMSFRRIMRDLRKDRRPILIADTKPERLWTYQMILMCGLHTGQESVRGTVTTSAEQPRSYMVSTPSGDLRRNRSHLNIVPPSEQPSTLTDNQSSSSSVSADQRPPIMTRLQI